MREIKFRAWDIVNKGFIAGFNMVNYHVYFNKGMNPSIFRYSSEWAHGEYILEQFTGLKDKNGVAIYEGDYLSKDYPYDANPPHCTETGVVKFMEGGFCCWFEIDHDAWHYIQEQEINRYYVTGNIHQNPELLEESR